MKRLIKWMLFLSIAGILIGDVAFGLTISKESTLAPSTFAYSFGNSVSAGKNTIVVGASTNSNSAYVYRFHYSHARGWVEEQKLVAHDATNNGFGNSVSLSGDVIVVGAPADGEAGKNSGSAYVYRFNGSGWIEEQKLIAHDAAAGDLFGREVSVSKDVIVVGTLRSRAAYVYRFNGSNWIEEQKLSPDNSTSFFGFAVSVSEDVIVVGDPLADSIRIYRFNGWGWVEEQKLSKSKSVRERYFFGASVSVSKDVIVVGASLTDSAYVYRFNGSRWVEQQKLTANNAASGEKDFGNSVSVSGDIIVVGALQSGSFVYKFNGRSWIEKQKIPVINEGMIMDCRSNSVSASDDLIVIGIPNFSFNQPGPSGSAEVYRIRRHRETVTP